MTAIARWLLIAAALAPGAVLAQPYAAAQIGYGSGSFTVDSPFNGYVDDSALSIGAEVGYGFGDRWAAEVGITRFATFDGRATPCAPGGVCTAVLQDEDVRQTLYRASLVRRFEIGDFRLFGKAGYYRARIGTDIDVGKSTFHENGLMIGAGLRWYFSEPWSVSLEASRYDDNVSQISVGFGWGLRLLAR